MADVSEQKLAQEERAPDAPAAGLVLQARYMGGFYFDIVNDLLWWSP